LTNRCDIVGIDVGGTNTDAVLVRGESVIAAAKTPTNPDNLLESTRIAYEQVAKEHDGANPIELHLSTTLSTNAIIEGRGDPVVVLAVPGPGMSFDDMGLGFPVHVLSGYIDHRGREVAPVDASAARAVVKAAANNGAEALAIVGKFSHRNPAHELKIEQEVTDEYPQYSPATLGHRLSGRPGFPRRLATAYLNASIARQQSRFAEMIQSLLAGSGVERVFILKADGGTMRLKESMLRPIETILSGPAASTMGAQALTNHHGANAVIVDIGGTTTDISVQVAGEPIYDRYGAEISGHKTLVPALFSRSIGLGGDSEIHVELLDGAPAFRIGPRRAGTPVVRGGSMPTPTDAAVAAGLSSLGNREAAMHALAKLGEPCGIDAAAVAQAVLDAFTRQLADEIEAVYMHLESRPAYTVLEILAPPDIRPQVLIGLGAPAPFFIPDAARRLGIACEILPHCEEANAVGAAASRPTAAVTLHADTMLGVLTVPEADHMARIRHPMTFGVKQARREAIEWATRFAEEIGVDTSQGVSIVEEESFNVVRGFYTAGHIYSIKAQVRPEVRRIAADGAERPNKLDQSKEEL